MNLSEKKKLVEKLHERLKKVSIAILADYKGLDVKAINDLRRKLNEAEVELQVVKNTLLVRASEGTDVALIKEQFKGPSAIALSYGDPVAPAKVLSDFVKENEKLEIKAGVMKGRTLELSEIKALSALPSREVLLAQLLSTMNAVPTSLARALSDVPRRLLNSLRAINDQKEAA